MEGVMPNKYCAKICFPSDTTPTLMFWSSHNAQAKNTFVHAYSGEVIPERGLAIHPVFPQNQEYCILY
eukprot:scaffold44468_cov29-Attheya_sp.AAC.1